MKVTNKDLMKYKMTRKVFAVLSALLTLLLLATGCESEKTLYDGPDYIMFSDSLYVFPIQDSEEYFDIPISATKPAKYDRVVAIEIIDKNSNAIEGKHYQLETNSITIKAGELASSVRVRGMYENIDVSDSLGFSLRLIADSKTHWDIYGIDANVVMKKTCPFDIELFTGYCVIVSSYFEGYMPGVNTRLIKSRLDPDNPNGIILENYFYDGYDVKVEFDLKNPLHPLLISEEQVFASTSEAFGTIYGDGDIYMFQPPLYTSYYSTCEKFIVQYMTLHVPNVGTVGTYLNIVEWISDDEAERLKENGL